MTTKGVPEIPEEWASDTNFPPGTDDWSGQPSKVAVPLAVQQQGALPGQLPAEYLNWLLNLLTAHARALATVPVQNWWNTNLNLGTVFALDVCYRARSGNLPALWLLAGGNGTNKLCFSNDLEFIRLANTGTPLTNVGACAVAQGTDTFLVGGIDGTTCKLIYSTNAGTSWNPVTLAGAFPVNALEWHPGGGGFFIAGTSGGRFFRASSSTPNSWSGLSNPWTIDTTQAIKRIVSNGSVVVATVASDASDGLPRIAYSTNHGQTWTATPINVGNWSGLAYSPQEGLWMAVSTGGGLLNSVDGQTWSPVSYQPTLGLFGAADLAVFGKLWVCATNGVFSRENIRYSLDRGLNWHALPVGQSINDAFTVKRLIACQGHFLLSFGGVVYRSLAVDGVNQNPL